MFGRETFIVRIADDAMARCVRAGDVAPSSFPPATGGTNQRRFGMRIPALLAAALLAAAPIAKAQDYRAEIMAKVVDRCYAATIRYKLLVARKTHRIDIPEATILRSLKEEEHTERLIASLAEMVTGKDRSDRMRLYDIAYVECFLSGATKD